MALLKNWQSLLSAAVGCAGDAGAHHIEAVEGGFGRFFALLQSFGRFFHAGRASDRGRKSYKRAYEPQRSKFPINQR